MIIKRRKDIARLDEKSSVGLLYDRYVPKLLSICLRYTGNHEDAKDVLHDGFLKIIGNIGQFKSRNENSLEAWMKKIIVNTALNFLRSSNKEKIFLPLENNLNGYGEIAGEEEEEPLYGADFSGDELLEMICKLPAGYRTVFNLYVMENYSHKEIAERLNCSENTSKSQLSKARAMLRKNIKQLSLHENQTR